MIRNLGLCGYTSRKLRQIWKWHLTLTYSKYKVVFFCFCEEISREKWLNFGNAVILKESGSSPSVRGPSALLSARLFSFQCSSPFNSLPSLMWKSLFSSTDSRSFTSVYYMLTLALTLNHVCLFFLWDAALTSHNFVSILCHLFVYFIVEQSVFYCCKACWEHAVENTLSLNEVWMGRFSVCLCVSSVCCWWMNQVWMIYTYILCNLGKLVRCNTAVKDVLPFSLLLL